MAKRTKGRQKLEMVKIQNEINLQVTFSKRRYGLFKKASELISLCGAEVGLIVFSPSGKVYTFGHPDVQSVICRYLGSGVGLSGGGSATAVAGNDAGLSNFAAAAVNALNDSIDDNQYSIPTVQLGQELNNKESLLEKEKKVGKILSEKIKKSTLYNRWSKLSVDELDMSELLEYKAALQRLKMRINAIKLKKSMEMMNQIAALPPPNPDPFFGGNNNNFGNPYFGYNNLNTNDGTFLPPFDPSFSLVPPNPHQNLGNEEELSSAREEVGAEATTFASSSYPPPGFFY